MDNNSECSKSKSLRTRLSFGVPLEDIFPPNDIHPTIKNLFLQAYKNAVKNKFYSVEQVISCLQGTLDERLTLKEKVVNRLDIKNEETSPGTLIWIIRHFLGLLPLPLLPRYTDGQIYKWSQFSEECRNYLKHNSWKSAADLLTSIALELRKLPFHNFLLITTLCNFLRSLSVYPQGEPHLNKFSASSLTKYFTNAVLFRPYRPGCITNRDRRYYPLFLFMILKWNKIKQFFNNSNTSQILSFDYYKQYRLCSLHFNDSCSSKNLIDTSTQTDLTEVQSILQNFPNAFNNFINVSCQTDLLLLNYAKNMNTPKCIDRRRTCCCCYGSHYNSNKKTLFEKQLKESSLLEEELPESINSKDDEENESWKQINLEDTSNNCIYPDLKNLSPVKEKRWSAFIHSKSFNKNDEYIYDEYCDIYEDIRSISNLVVNENESEYSYENSKSFNFSDSKDDTGVNLDLLERVSKIGWSYTSPRNDDDEASVPLQPIGWNIPKINYSIYFDTKEQLNDTQEEKDKCEGINSNSSPGEEVLEETKNNKSFVNLQKIKSKLESIKSINLKKMTPKRTTSFDNISSKIKYQKMGSARSTIF